MNNNEATDIEYERNGVRKFAQVRFKDALIAEGWSVVGESTTMPADEQPRPRRGRPPKAGFYEPVPYETQSAEEQ